MNINGKLEPVWTHDSDYLEKEKTEGKYYGPRNPKTYEGTIMEDTIKKMREGNNQNASSPFGKSPQE